MPHDEWRQLVDHVGVGSGSGWRLTTKGKARSGWLLALSALASLPVAAILALAGLPVWVQVLTVALGALIGLLVDELRTGRSQHAAAVASLRAQVAGAPDRLPLVKDVDVATARVHPALHDVGYVARTAERDVAEALAARRKVLIAGTPMSGKTRMALHIAQSELRGHQLLIPRYGQSLHNLISGDIEPERLLLWLDDLERFLGGDGLAPAELEAFCGAGGSAIATIGAGNYSDLLPKDGLKPLGWDVLSWFGSPVWLRWTADETDRALATVPPQVVDGVRMHGLSRYLGGGPLALAHFRAAEHSAPVGHALVRAAADWRRAGTSSPIDRDLIVALAPAYTGPPPTTSALQAAFEWATSTINGTVSLLREDSAGYDVLDYVVDEVTAEGRPIPEQLWDLAAERGTPDLVDVGFAAATRHARQDKAETLWGLAEDPVAMYNLGLLHYRDGGRAQSEAERYWRAAANAGDPAAMYSLGVLLSHRSEPAAREEAERWSRQAAQAAGRRTFERPPHPSAAIESSVRFTGAADDDERESLSRALLGYRRYLNHHRVPLGEIPTVHIDPSAQVAYPEPSQDRLFVGKPTTSFPSITLHEYSHWVLEDVRGVPRDTWTQDVQAIEAGLAYYLPCSFAGSARGVAFIDIAQGTAASEDMLDDAHRVGLRWATVFWQLRSHLSADALDPEVLLMWRQVAPTDDDRGVLADRVRALRVVGDDTPVARIANQALIRTGLIA